MKQFFPVFALVILLFGAIQQVSAQETNHIRVRAGLSFVSGLVGLEYQKNNIACSVGWLPSSSATFGDDSVFRGVLSAKYIKSADTTGPWGALTFALNGSGVDFGDRVEGFNILGALAGYRFTFGEKIDLTIGGGYGLHMGLTDEVQDGTNFVDPDDALSSGTPLLDFTLGYAIK